MGLVLLVLVLLGLGTFLGSFRKRGRDAIARRFAADEVVLSETLAQSYGEASRGPTQARGNGALALTTGEVFFLLYVPERELRIPLASIREVSIVRGHLGKTGGARLLKIDYHVDGKADAIAWRLAADPETWKAKIESLRAASSTTS